jgi:hypothetical protein
LDSFFDSPASTPVVAAGKEKDFSMEVAGGEKEKGKKDKKDKKSKKSKKESSNSSEEEEEVKKKDKKSKKDKKKADRHQLLKTSYDIIYIYIYIYIYYNEIGGICRTDVATYYSPHFSNT